jgi:glycogen operon protein
MTDEQWEELHARCIGAFLNGDDIGIDRRGERVVDDRFLLLLNGHHDAIPFTVPPARWGAAWCLEVDTASGATPAVETATTYKPGDSVELEGRSVLVLRGVVPDA